EGEPHTYVGGDVIILTLKKSNSIFLSYYLNSSSAITQRKISAKGNIIFHIYASKLRDVILGLPPLEEQILISEYLNKKTSQINQITTNIQTQIQTLKELRKTLINDVVTGKLKVTQES
ncbi:MAG: restriction endonuclease subunit S, partial [Bacteroidota bacterium]